MPVVAQHYHVVVHAVWGFPSGRPKGEGERGRGVCPRTRLVGIRMMMMMMMMNNE